jgi:hypothetical protein
MYTRAFLSVATLMGLTAVSLPAPAATYTAACGGGGDVSIILNQLAVMTGPNNALTVTGTCIGELNIQGFNGLAITGLSLTGDVFVSASTHVSIAGATITGSVQSSDHTSLVLQDSTVNGFGQFMHESSILGSNITFAAAGPGSAGSTSGILCLSGSDCTFSNTTVTGSSSGDPTAPSIGVQIASASRFNFASGRISGFDWGVHVWNHATAFFGPSCDTVSIDSNHSIGIYVRDGGLAKLEALPLSSLSSSCPSGMLISNNGSYGLLAEGGGLGGLYRTTVTGHATDGVRVQDGATVKVRSSSIDAATTTGRSARVKNNAHLWFDEETSGPSASSTLMGPVCVTGDSTVDTDNSSTKVTTTTKCLLP